MKNASKFLVAVAFTGLVLSANAQGEQTRFITDGMKWTEIERNIFNNEELGYDFVPESIWSYRTEGDTVINGLTYFKMYYDAMGIDSYGDTTYTYNAFYGLLREDDSNKVFTYHPLSDREFLVYDFKWEKGKELLYHGFILDDSGKFYRSLTTYTVIDEIDSVQLLDGLYYKCLKNNDGTIRIIQGIGDLSEFFFMNRYIGKSDGSYYELLCFQKGDQLIYLNPDYETCGEIKGTTSILPISSESSIKIYPNPTTGQLRVVSGGISDGGDIQIYDIVGKLVQQSPVSALSPETTIDISHLANGIYFLKVDNKMFKIVKK